MAETGGRQVEEAKDKARAALYERYRMPLLAFFARRTNPADAEDLVHDVVYRMIDSQDLSRIENADAFVFAAARNLLKDRARRAQVRERTQPDLESLAPDIEVFTPERVIQGRQDLAAVAAALADLEEKPRDMFILHRLDGMKHKEIAELYGLSVSSVEKYLMTAFAHIMETMDI